MVHAVERINSSDFMDSNGDVRLQADFTDDLGNIVDDLPEARIFSSVDTQPFAFEEPSKPAETALITQQERWDDLLGEMIDKYPSNDLARTAMIQKYGERPEGSQENSPEINGEKPVLISPDVVAIQAIYNEPILKKQIDAIDNDFFKSDAEKKREIAELVARRRAKLELNAKY